MYVVSYVAKSDLTAHSLLVLVRGAFKQIADKRAANPDIFISSEDALCRPILRTMMQLIGNQEIAAPLACLILMQERSRHKSHDFCYIPFGAARTYLREALDERLKPLDQTSTRRSLDDARGLHAPVK